MFQLCEPVSLLCVRDSFSPYSALLLQNGFAVSPLRPSLLRVLEVARAVVTDTRCFSLQIVLHFFRSNFFFSSYVRYPALLPSLEFHLEQSQYLI